MATALTVEGKPAARIRTRVTLPPAGMPRPVERGKGTEARMLDTRLLTWSLGLFAVVSFLLCVAYGLVAPQALHMHTFLETVLPGFRWLTGPGFFIGLLESFLYGVYAGLVFGWIHNALARRWRASH